MSHRNQRIVWAAVMETSYNEALFRALSRSGSDVDVVHLGRIDGRGPDLLEYREGQPRARRGGAWWILREIARGRADLFVFSGWHGWKHRAVLAAAMLRGVPFVIWTDTPALSGSLKHRVRNLCVRAVSTRARAVMGTGKAAVKALRQMGLSSERVRNFPYWVDAPGELCMRELGAPTRFVCIGRLVAYKGFDLAIRALAELAPSVWSLDIIGEGPERTSLESLARRLGADDSVRFLGWMKPDALSRYLRETPHYLVHPARGHEPFGVVLLESMAAGVPPVATRHVGAAIDRIESGRNGVLLDEPAEVSALRAALSSLIGDEELWQSMRSATYRTAQEWSINRAAGMLWGSVGDQGVVR